ncbi:MAG TPA: hypothetical protein VFD92_02555 [Candidatus Binatia bacterium]|nr:hypothetical protein [Candidatus Binatia bacterium]
MVGALVATGTVARSHPAAGAVCDAAAFSCPAVGTCVITGTWNVGSNCILGFGARSVEIRGTLQADSLGGSFSVTASNLTLNAGKLKSLGDTSHAGGSIDVDVTGTFAMNGAGPRVDTSGNGGGGGIALRASAIDLANGVITADGGSGDTCGDGGAIEIDARSGPGSISNTVRTTTGSNDCGGGSITIAGASVTVSGALDAHGGASASDDGIFVHATAGDVVFTSTSSVDVSGTGQPDGFGANAGPLLLVADVGNVSMSAAPVALTGRSPDGLGGSIAIEAAGDVSLNSPITLYGGTMGFGGDLVADAGGDLSVAGNVTATGGMTFPYGEGGSVDLSAAGHVSIGATVDVSGATGGFISVDEGALVDVSGVLRARGSRGPGGGIELFGCAVSVGGTLDAGASNGGTAGLVDLTGNSMSIAAGATLTALPCEDGQCTSLTVRTGSPAIDPLATILPAPVVIVDPLVPAC